MDSAAVFHAHPIDSKHLDLNSVKELPESHAWFSEVDSPNGLSGLDLVPVINLEDPNAMELIGHACKTWGIFQVTNHGIPANLIEEMDAAGRELFALPMEKKLQAAREGFGLPGYGSASISRFFSKLMWSEGFTIFGSPYEHARKLWPNDCRRFCDVTQKYKEELNKLAEKMMFLMLGSLGVTREDVKWVGSKETSPLQLFSYPPCPDPDRTTGLGAHTDSVILTFIHQGKVSGLQAHREGFGWVTIPPVEGALVVNVGDMLHILSNGLYPSVLHRAMVNRTQQRLSLIYLYGPPSNVEVSPILELTDENHPPLYRKVTWTEYLGLKKKYFNKALSSIRLCPTLDGIVDTKEQVIK